MDVLIRGIDSEVYAKLKARASERGLKIGEALTDAIKTWMNNSPEKNEREGEQDLNVATFRRMRRFLEKNHRGNWVLIAKGEVVKLADSLEEIIEAKKNEGLSGRPSLVFKVGETGVRRTLGLNTGRKAR
nr:hypothetical protein [Candidatus Freyarchaeota archaeon]